MTYHWFIVGRARSLRTWLFAIEQRIRHLPSLRRWARDNGWPEIGARGSIPQAGLLRVPPAVPSRHAGFPAVAVSPSEAKSVTRFFLRLACLRHGHEPGERDYFGRPVRCARCHAYDAEMGWRAYLRFLGEAARRDWNDRALREVAWAEQSAAMNGEWPGG